MVCGNFESNYIPKKNKYLLKNQEGSKLHVNNV
jgi:hypothetical protein